MTKLRVLSWNIRANCGITRNRLDRVTAAIKAFDADIVLLQEVSRVGGVPEQLRAQLGLRGWYFSGTEASDKAYGNVVASKYPVECCRFETTPAVPWPELLAFTTVATPIGDITVVSAHMPNGSDKKHGWKKIDTFDALASALLQTEASPWIVGGDLNEPRTVLPGNHVISFGADEDGVVRGNWRGRPNAQWQAAVERVLRPTETNVHAWLSRNNAPVTTHVVHGVDRFFDHLLTSAHFEVVDAGFEHAWREGADPMSDHSGAWAAVRFNVATA